MAQDVASITTKIVGFPYMVESPYAKTVAWEVRSDDQRYYRILKKKYKSKDLAIASDKRIQREVGMNFDLSGSIERIRHEKSGMVYFESSITVDLAWSLENDDFNMPDKSIPELDDPTNWPKWIRKMPVTITMLKKCQEIAKDVSEKSGVKIVVSRDGYVKLNDAYGYGASFDASNMTQEQFLKEVQRYCKAMVRAYRKYEPWLIGSEYWKLIRARKHKK